MWTTRTSWSRRRRVVAKAEWTQGRGQSALRRHLAARAPSARPAPLREGLLRPRRDGEPDQGVPARPLCRPHLDRHDARQPAAPVVRLDGLCAAVRPAPDRPARHRRSPRPPAAPSVSSCSRSARSCASASAASRSPWRRPVRPLELWGAPRSGSTPPPWRAPRPPDTRRRARHHRGIIPRPTETASSLPLRLKKLLLLLASPDATMSRACIRANNEFAKPADHSEIR